MEAIRIGNIESDINTGTELPMYLASGDFGARFDKFGLMNSIADDGFMHCDFHHHGVYNMDFFVKPLRAVYKNFSPEKLTYHHRKLDIYDGILETTLESDEYSLHTKACFNPEMRDVFMLEAEWSGCGLPDIRFEPMPEYDFSYSQKLSGSLALTKLEDDFCGMRTNIGTASGAALIKVFGDASVSFDGGVDVRLTGENGKTVIILALCGTEREKEAISAIASINAESCITEAASAWHRRWGNGRISFDGNDELLKLFYRGIYNLLCNHSASSNTISPPMGWAGMVWTFHFPQDFEFIAPVLLKMGYSDIVKSKVEMYTRYIPVMCEFTKRIFNAEGTMWAWEFPIGNGEGLFPDGEGPNIYQYEIHNAAYPAKLAWDAICYLHDDDWSREYALPIIFGSAEFYASILKKEDGKWGIEIKPSMSQDEFGGFNQKNYLCALYSAEYTLKTAVRAAELLDIQTDALVRWKEILTDGLAFNRLLQPETGIYMIYEADVNEYKLGKMKHPVPLLPVSFIPKGKLNEHEKNAYDRRFELCANSGNHIFYGWTLADIMLASTHMGDADGFWQAVSELRLSDYVDPDWITTYETSGSHSSIYYSTNIGIICDAILNGVVSDYFGEIRINNADFRNLSYKNLHLSDGTVISGN